VEICLADSVLALNRITASMGAQRAVEPWKCCRDVISHRNSAGFNGATAVEPWKWFLPWPCTANRPALFGFRWAPRLLSRGIFVPGEIERPRKKLLQWGHGWLSRGNDGKYVRRYSP